MQFKRISITETYTLIAEETTQIVDIRDEQSFSMGHIPGAIHLSNTNLRDYIDSADLDAPTIVVCYHGHSSQSAAQLLSQQGFAEVYSMDGGFEAWRSQFPVSEE